MYLTMNDIEVGMRLKMKSSESICNEACRESGQVNPTTMYDMPYGREVTVTYKSNRSTIDITDNKGYVYSPCWFIKAKKSNMYIK